MPLKVLRKVWSAQDTVYRKAWEPLQGKKRKAGEGRKGREGGLYQPGNLSAQMCHPLPCGVGCVGQRAGSIASHSTGMVSSGGGGPSSAGIGAGRQRTGCTGGWLTHRG